MNILKGNKLPEKYKYYGGPDWFTISESLASDLIEFSRKEEQFQQLFVHSLSGAEIYYVSIFEMIKGDRLTENDNMLRYVDWKDRGQKLAVGSPNTCTMDFLDEIEASNAFFARKFDIRTDERIVEYFINK